MKQQFSYILLLATVLLTTACYRMPTEDDYSLIPTTNNRDITRDKSGDSLVPSVTY